MSSGGDRNHNNNNRGPGRLDVVHNSRTSCEGDGTAETGKTAAAMVDGSDEGNEQGGVFYGKDDERPNCLPPAKSQSLLYQPPPIPPSNPRDIGAEFSDMDRQFAALAVNPGACTVSQATSGEKLPTSSLSEERRQLAAISHALAEPTGLFMEIEKDEMDPHIDLLYSSPPPMIIETAGTERNPEARERTARLWIEAVTKEPFFTFGSETFARNVKTGERLCRLVNTIRPGTIPHVHESQLGYQQMENIEKFLMACRAMGVQDSQLVGVIHIFEMKDTPDVVECLHALGQAVQSSCPAFTGPRLGRPSRPVDSILATGSSSTETDADDAFGDNFQRISVAEKDEDDDHDNDSKKRGLVLNMHDVERPRTIGRTIGRTSNTSVGRLNDLRPPTPLSARAQKMCPFELVSSPRALAANSDPIGHPARSPTFAALSTTPGSAGRTVRGCTWGTGSCHSNLNQSPKKTVPSKLSSRGSRSVQHTTARASDIPKGESAAGTDYVNEIESEEKKNAPSSPRSPVAVGQTGDGGKLSAKDSVTMEEGKGKRD